MVCLRYRWTRNWEESEVFLGVRYNVIILEGLPVAKASDHTRFDGEGRKLREESGLDTRDLLRRFLELGL